MGACTSECNLGLEKLDLADPEFSTVDASSERELYGVAEKTLCLDAARSESMVEERTSVEQRIERSKCHWSEILTMKLGSKADDGEDTEESDVDEEEEMARVKADNEQVFRSLQDHPTWGSFFLTFGEGSGRSMEVGEKFAEGGQAELFHAHITWRNPKNNEKDREIGRQWIVKVFKKGTWLRQLQHQWPRGYLHYRAQQWEENKLGKPAPCRYTCDVYGGTLLVDGRFAFVMNRDDEDLRTRIDRHMTMRTGQHSGPFSEQDCKGMMYFIAEGMEWLHSRDIVHRDLKASNVLFTDDVQGWACYVADFECSIESLERDSGEPLRYCKHVKIEVFIKNPNCSRKRRMYMVTE